MNKKCLGIIALLLLVILGGVYKFMFQGNTTKSSDGRTAINLSAGERDIVLTEMRAFLQSMQQITEGISKDNLKLVTESAKKSGVAAQKGVPGTLVGKLPMDFKKLGSDTHTKFDQLALDAIDLKDKDHTLSQLSVLMQNCVACHATYKIGIAKE